MKNPGRLPRDYYGHVCMYSLYMNVPVAWLVDGWCGVGSCMGGDRRWADADADRDERGGRVTVSLTMAMSVCLTGDICGR